MAVPSEGKRGQGQGRAGRQPHVAPGLQPHRQQPGSAQQGWSGKESPGFPAAAPAAA